MNRSPRERLAIERNTPSRNARGELLDTWSVIARVYAALYQLTGRERVAAMQVNSETTWRAEFRFTPGLDVRPADRIRYAGRTLEITAVIDLQEQHRQVLLDLKEVA